MAIPHDGPGVTTSNTVVQRLSGPNPFAVDPALDLLHAVRADVPGWSETMYFHAWSPDNGVGVFVHCGRWPSDTQLWWAQVIALLPDGRLVVDRLWGRARDDRGPATGNLRVQCIEPQQRWRLEFDGAGAVATLADTAAGPVGAGPAVPLRFTLDLDAVAPVWDLHRALGVDGSNWAAHHHNQGFLVRGEIRCDTATWAVDGVAHRDHSSGPRDVTGLGGLQSFVFVFPGVGRVVNGLISWDRSGVVDHRIAGRQQDGLCEVSGGIDVTGLDSFVTHEPRAMTVVLERDGASDESYSARWLHGYTLSLLDPNENIIGADLTTVPDPLLITQSTVEVTAPDGSLGYGVIERDYRPSLLPPRKDL